MKPLLFSLGAIVAGLVSISSAQAADPTIAWDGRRLTLTDAELPAEVTLAAQAWATFVEEYDYAMTLVDDGRLLLISEGGRSTTERQVELIERTMALFERDLPTPPPSSARSDGKEGKGGRPADDEIPEDPEGPPPGWEPPSQDAPIETYAWGAGTTVPDTQTIVFLILKDEDHYRATLDVLAGVAEYLAEWSQAARSDLGYVLEEPLAGAYVLNASGQEEWNPDNELVNRIARLCLLRRFGQQPNWLVQGYAWHAEFEIQGAVYVFPHRNEFVSVGEHTDWDKEIERRFAEDTPDLRDLTGWSRGTYDAEASRFAWGLVDWALRAHPRKLSLVLDDLRRFRDEDNRIETSDSTWTRDRDYKMSGSKQRSMLQERLGKSFLRDFAKSLR